MSSAVGVSRVLLLCDAYGPEQLSVALRARADGRYELTVGDGGRPTPPLVLSADDLRSVARFFVDAADSGSEP